jgi:hypothetical protein
MNKTEDKQTLKTSTEWIKSNSYAIIIVLLIALLVFMFYPTLLVYLFLALVIPISLGIITEMFFQTDYYDSLNYQLSRLEKTMLISGVVGFSALSIGYFAGPIHNWLESFIDI